MELIWSTAGALGGVLAVLSEGADLVLIGDFMNAVHADQHVLEFCLPSCQRCDAFSSAAVHAATQLLHCNSGVTTVARVSWLR